LRGHRDNGPISPFSISDDLVYHSGANDVEGLETGAVEHVLRAGISSDQKISGRCKHGGNTIFRAASVVKRESLGCILLIESLLISIYEPHRPQRRFTVSRLHCQNRLEVFNRITRETLAVEPGNVLRNRLPGNFSGDVVHSHS